MCHCDAVSPDIPMINSTDGDYDSVKIIAFGLSTFGMVLSIVALVFLLLTSMLFTEWRKNNKNQVLIQFMVARFFYTLVRYVNIVYQFFRIVDSYFSPFYLDAIPMAYTEMTLITWMFIFIKQMHDSFVNVVTTRTQSMLKISLVAWIVPATISIVIYVVCKMQFDRELKFFIFYLFLLKWPMLCANGVFLVLVFKYILSTNKSKTTNNPWFVLVMVTLIFTFCFQQAIEDVYKMIFVVFLFEKRNVYCTPLFFVFVNIITVFHCAFSIMFWLFANKRTRVLWGFTKEKSCAQTQANLPHVARRSCSTIL